MADEPTGGNTADSPTAGADDQGQDAKDQVLDAVKDDSTDQTGQGTADSQTADDGKVDGDGDTGSDDKEKPPPYDQDPKWKAARAAEKKVNDLLESHGYDSMDELVEALNRGQTLSQLVGNYDANELVNEYQEFQRVKQYWAEQEAARQKANEQPEETIARLEREKKEIIEGRKREEADRQAIEESKRVVQEFDDGVRKFVNSDPDISDSDKKMLVQFLGVDNEMTVVDYTDKAAVKRALGAGKQRFSKFIKDIKQKAVDEYIAGKSDVTPMTKSDTGSPVTDNVRTEPEPLPDGATVDDVFAAAKDEMTENLMKLFDAAT